jgi:gliding motility-associated-like protein
MKKCITLSCFLLFQITLLHAQTPVIEWHKPIGGFTGDYCKSISPTADGGYIMGGYSEFSGGDITGYSSTMALMDYWVIKMKSNGDIEWQKCLGSDKGQEYGADVRQTPDGGYIVVGSSASKDCNVMVATLGLDFWLVKLAPNGDIVWDKSYGASEHEYAYSVDITPDGGYVLGGNSLVNGVDMDALVMKVDGQGNLLWQKQIGGPGEDNAQSVRATADGGCIMAGYNSEPDGGVVVNNHGKRDFWIVKFDATGNIQWQNSLGGSMFDMANSIQLTPDGGYIVAGMTGSNDGDVTGNHQSIGVFADFWVVKLTGAGVIQWQKCYGGNFNEIAYFIQLAPDGGYLVTGSAESANNDASCNAGLTDIWTIKISNTGVLEWQKSLGGNYFDEGWGIVPLNDGSCVVAGYTCSKDVSGFHPSDGSVYPGGGQGSCADYWIVKLSPPMAAAPDPIVTINPANTNVCAGSLTTITASVRYGGTNPIYRWERNGVTVGGNTSTYSASDFVNNDKVKCIVTRGGSCETSFQEASDEVTIHINPTILNPQINITTNTTSICGCTHVTATAIVAAGGTAPAFRWYINGVQTGIIDPVYHFNSFNPGDVLTCKYMDKSGCIAGGSVLSNAITFTTGAPQPPSITISTPTNAICTGSIVVFTAVAVNAGTNPVYQWKINGQNAGNNSTTFTPASINNGDKVSCSITTQTVSQCITGANATSNEIVMTITTQSAPIVTITTPDNIICANSTATFTAVTTNAGILPSYQWKVNGVNSGTNSNIFSASFISDGDIITCAITTDPLYTCALTTQAVSNPIQITVSNDAAPALTIAASDAAVCAGTVINFTATAVNAGTFPTYQWKVNNNSAGTNSAVYTATPKNGDIITCIITPGPNTCQKTPVTSNSITPVIYALPTVRITPIDTFIAVGSTVMLHSVTTGNIASYRWSPAAKLKDATLLNPVTIPMSDDATYELTVKDDKQCTSIAKATVRILRPLYMPTGFTPNHDGLNELYKIPSNVALTLKDFSVFDRWGNRIFSTVDINKGWDGTSHGRPCDSGVFVYMIRGKNDKGEVFIKGTFTLIR